MFWEQFVDFPTHQKNRRPDLVLASSQELVSGVRLGGYLGKADHQILEVDLEGPPKNNDSIEMIQDWARADMLALTSVVCKVMESLVRDAIVEHLAQHQLIRSSQHVFTAGRSCLTNLLEYMEELTKLIDEGKAVDLIYLDFSKAFNLVGHQRLLATVEGLCIRGKVLAWLGEWLSNMKQRGGPQWGGLRLEGSRVGRGTILDLPATKCRIRAKGVPL